MFTKLIQLNGVVDYTTKRILLVGGTDVVLCIGAWSAHLSRQSRHGVARRRTAPIQCASLFVYTCVCVCVCVTIGFVCRCWNCAWKRLNSSTSQACISSSTVRSSRRKNGIRSQSRRRLNKSMCVVVDKREREREIDNRPYPNCPYIGVVSCRCTCVLWAIGPERCATCSIRRWAWVRA